MRMTKILKENFIRLENGKRKCDFRELCHVNDINKLNFHQRRDHRKKTQVQYPWRNDKYMESRIGARCTALESWILAGMSWQTARLGHLSRPVSSGKCESLRRRPGKFLASIQGRARYERRRNRKMGLDLVRSCPQAGFITRMLDLLVCSSWMEIEVLI